MQSKACTVMDLRKKEIVKNPSQFELSKALYSSGVLNKVKLTPTSKLVLFALIQHYNPCKVDIFPSQKFLATQLGIGISSVERSIKELSQKGLIIYETKKVNRYRFTNIFFNLINLKDQHPHFEGNNTPILKDKQIKEQENKKIKFLNNNFAAPQKKYEHKTAETGINYQKFEREQVEKGSPLDYTKEQALEWINSLPSFLKKNSYFAKELQKKWNL